MAFEDRDYYREGSGSARNPAMWLLTGSLHLFTVFGIRVRIHASLLLFIALVLLFGLGEGSNVQARVQSMGVLFLVVLLHEFGHCFAARWTGGNAEEILLTPLGGLAMTQSLRTPWSRFVTVAGGPLVNVIICLVCGLALFVTIGVWPLGPWTMGKLYAHNLAPGWFQLSSYLFWFYSVSYYLLLFNLLPVYPLDGGQLLQAILWKPMGYYKSMLLTVNIGLPGSVVMAAVAIATMGSMMGGFLLLFIAVTCFMNCLQMRRFLLAEGPYGFEEDQTYSAAYEPQTPKRKQPSRWAAQRANKAARAQRAEQEQIDAILAKVSAYGMHSLTWIEKRRLRKATERQRQADLARAGRRG